MPTFQRLLRTGCAALLFLLAPLFAHSSQASTPVPVEVSLTPLQNTYARGTDVLVRISFTNRSSQPVQLLRWRTSMEEAGMPLFEVRRDGQRVPYLGRRIKRPPPGPGDYLTLGPGSTLAETVELSSLYDMRVTGSYTIRYASPAFPGDAVGLQAVNDELVSAPAQVFVEGPLPPGSHLPPQPGLAAATPGLATSKCSNAQQEQLASAFAAGRAMAADSQQYMQRGTIGARYLAWFGEPDGARQASVAARVAAIRDAFENQAVEIDCSCTAAYYAYVYPAQPYRIYVCKAFWQAANTGTDSRGGTLLHELSHFDVVAGTDDYVYGHSGAQALARSNPARAIANADSYEYFGENSPPQQKQAAQGTR